VLPLYPKACAFFVQVKWFMNATGLNAQTGISDMDQFLDKNQCCMQLCVSATKFYSMIRAGELPKPIKLGTKSVWSQHAITMAMDRLKAALKK
jgi:predicted DNA-binding transcriptional regulator AlpA